MDRSLSEATILKIFAVTDSQFVLISFYSKTGERFSTAAGLNIFELLEEIGKQIKGMTEELSFRICMNASANASKGDLSEWALVPDLKTWEAKYKDFEWPGNFLDQEGNPLDDLSSKD